MERRGFVLIDVANVSKVYKTNKKEPGLKGAIKNMFHSEWIEKKAIDDITFSVNAGQSVACIGENGAGKSTLIKMLIGILHSSSGKISVFGKMPGDDRNAFLKKIGVIFGQKTNLWVDIPIIESYQAIQALYKVEKTVFKRNLNMVTELLDLAPILSSPARKLSLGQRMKADIGMIFLHNPQLLFLDEPTIGLDVNIKHTIRSFIREMNKEKGVTVFLTSHDLDDIKEICDQAIVLSKGKIFYDGSLGELKDNYVKTKTVEIVGRSVKDIYSFLPAAKISIDSRKTKIIYEIDMYSPKEVIAAVSEAFEIADITIVEPTIQEVVSEIFLRQTANEEEAT